MTISFLKEIKIEIRSLLISSQNGLTEKELCLDYSLFNSQRSIPYQMFGYSTITDFLNSLTDVLYRSSDGYIHPIVDQSTEHIFKFVQQQRTNKKKKQPSVLYNQRSKPSISRNKQKKTASLIMPSSQQMYLPVDANKAVPMMKQAYRNNNKNEGSLSRLKPTMNESLSKFERINVTNELLQRLLIHFQQQQPPRS